MKPWLILGLLLSGLVFGTGAGYKNVSVRDLLEAKEPGRVVLDVRQPEEFAAGHVAGAKLIPLDQLPKRLGELSKSATVYVFCRSGNRSRQASEILVKAGFKDVRNVVGGILAWERAGYPVQK